MTAQRLGDISLCTILVLYVAALGSSLAGWRQLSGLLLGAGTGLLIITAVVAGILHERRS